MRRRLIAASWQLATLVLLAGGAAAFLWMPDSRWFWLALTVVLPPVVILSSLCLQSAAVAAISKTGARLWFQAVIALLLVAGLVPMWRYAGRWYWWALFWLIVPPLLGPSFVAGRWKLPRFSPWFPVAAFVPALLVMWTPRLASPAADIGLFVLRFTAALAVFLWCLVRAFEDWAPTGGSPDSAA